MIETREKTIVSKVFIKKDIQGILNIFSSEFTTSKTAKKHTYLKMQIRCADQTRYESEGDDLISEGNIFDLKKIESIDIDYHDFDADKGISIHLNHDGNTFSNRLSVTGSDKNWVAGIFSQLETKLNSIKPQEHWFISFLPLIGCVSTIVFDLTLVKIMAMVLSSKSFGSTVGDYIVLIFPSIWLAALLVYWVKKLWPSIEFDFGPEHAKTEKIRRNRIGVFFTLIIVPSLFSIVTYLFPPK